MKVGFIGLGLIGGSIAKALKKYYPDTYIMAYARTRETLDLALEDGAVDYACSSVNEEFAPCDYLFLCAPVSYNSAYLETIKDFVRPECIITDVGSVKSKIHEKVIAVGLEDQFIGGHPMAGSEKSGFSYARAHLIENAFYVITPSATVSPAKVEEFRQIVETIKAIPLLLDYEQHDYVTAAISHLPHIIASSLVNLVKESDSEDGLMKMIAAGGFKDITRIASSSPVMWQQICLTNSRQILKVLDAYMDQLAGVRDALAADEKDKIYDVFDQANDYRNSIPNTSAGPLKKIHAIYCDIIDEAGAIATIATIFATHNISIKNIGIVHNREFEEGVLRIEFYEREATDLAADLLERHHYSVVRRS